MWHCLLYHLLNCFGRLSLSNLLFQPWHMGLASRLFVPCLLPCTVSLIRDDCHLPCGLRHHHAGDRHLFPGSHLRTLHLLVCQVQNGPLNDSFIESSVSHLGPHLHHRMKATRSQIHDRARWSCLSWQWNCQPCRSSRSSSSNLTLASGMQVLPQTTWFGSFQLANGNLLRSPYLHLHHRLHSASTMDSSSLGWNSTKEASSFQPCPAFRSSREPSTSADSWGQGCLNRQRLDFDREATQHRVQACSGWSSATSLSLVYCFAGRNSFASQCLARRTAMKRGRHFLSLLTVSTKNID